MSGLGNFIKTVVSRSGKTGGAGAGSLVTTSGGAGVELKKALVTAMGMAGLSEKEWKCHCGHVFRAAGEWYPTEPSYCEAPGCPNPTFYLDGPGRAMLESGKGNAAATTDTKSVGGRFK
jgi:hypothetical protein